MIVQKIKIIKKGTENGKIRYVSILTQTHKSMTIMQIFVDTLKAKIALTNFLLVLSIALVSCSVFYSLILPFTYWSLFGEGAESDCIESLPVNLFITNWSALIIVLIFILIGLYRNIKLYKLARAKSYLLTSFIIIIIYLLRNQILTLLFQQS